MQTATLFVPHLIESDCSRSTPSPAEAEFPLRLAREGEWVKITSLAGGKGLHDRFAGVGLWIGATLQVLNNPMNGKLLISHSNTRLFLGGGMAHKVRVIRIKGEKR